MLDARDATAWLAEVRKMLLGLLGDAIAEGYELCKEHDKLREEAAGLLR